uniref:Uncharacterized protein n=1 Tax=viral metagenome TaxID=1070528 RepID=A0A6M3L0R9_9ZZZZ
MSETPRYCEWCGREVLPGEDVFEGTGAGIICWDCGTNPAGYVSKWLGLSHIDISNVRDPHLPGMVGLYVRSALGDRALRPYEMELDPVMVGSEHMRQFIRGRIIAHFQSEIKRLLTELESADDDEDSA